ncbi:MAG: hypothetical protein DMG97_12790 [Acidobacteria bacterium]|nr:MAG: hypothetical protein DMG97_12790 [Acidobacteriota bacterium]
MNDTHVTPIAGATAPNTVSPQAPPSLFGALSWPKVRQIGFSVTDQVLAVGGMFTANVALARVQSKEEYGMFALSYSVYTFLTGLHNALILEPYSIHGSGRYHEHLSGYSRVMARSNATLGAGLTAISLSVWFVLRWRAPSLATWSLLGLALTVAILLTALFIRRTFYLQRRPDLAAKLSVIFFVTLAVLLGLGVLFSVLNGFSIFAIVAISWIVAGAFLGKRLPGFTRADTFSEVTPDHWSEHWKYARWVLATAFVFQLTTQGYYWLVAGFISVKEVAELRAIHILVTPVDLICIALDLLILPLMVLRYVSKRHAELVSLWKVFGLLNLSITGAYAVSIWIGGRVVLHSFYAGKFDDMAALLSLLVLLPIIMGIGNSVNVALKSMERPDLVFRAYVASGVATFVLGVPLVRYLGLKGAVCGMLTSASVYTIAMGTGLVITAGSKLRGVSMLKVNRCGF